MAHRNARLGPAGPHELLRLIIEMEMSESQAAACLSVSPCTAHGWKQRWLTATAIERSSWGWLWIARVGRIGHRVGPAEIDARVCAASCFLSRSTTIEADRPALLDQLQLGFRRRQSSKLEQFGSALTQPGQDAAIQNGEPPHRLVLIQDYRLDLHLAHLRRRRELERLGYVARIDGATRVVRRGQLADVGVRQAALQLLGRSNEHRKE